MKNELIPSLYNVFSKIYKKIFHEELSFEVINFLNNISYVGFGLGFATLFSFTFNVISGRLLGPSLYGEFALVESVAMFLYIPMLMGYHASLVKYNAEKKSYERQRTIISTTYLLVFTLIIVSIIVYDFFSIEISKLLSISKDLFHYSVIYSVLFVIYTLSTETLKSLHELKKYSLFKPLFSFTLLTCFLYFINIGFVSSRSMIYSMYIAYIVTSVVIIYLIRNYLKFCFDRKWISELTKYSFYAVMGGLSFVLYTNVDKLLINKYLNVMDVGVYRAYNYAFVSIIQLLIIVFGTVFFPYASMCSNKQILYKKINKMIPYILIMGLPVSLICGLIVLQFYGKDYILNIRLAFLFGIAGICIAIDNLYGQLISAIGVKGIKIVSLAAIIMALTNTFLNIVLIPLKGVEGAILATIVSFLFSISIMLSKRNYIYNSEGYDVRN
ncbi:MAG: oligosaccharide flippase family protein [Methanomethylovorans sp.]|jgi:O-antigen/teichoic acid export membrane protein|nr:oligosaccharide flippase family protein [Methanomethylovorans sp.]